MNVTLSLVACVAALSLAACAANTDDPTTQDPTQDLSQEQDIKAKRCGTFLNGVCPSGYVCDMSSVPPGNVGGSGVCKKKTCVQHVICAISAHFDPTTCACVPNQCVQNVLCASTAHFDHTTCKCVAN